MRRGNLGDGILDSTLGSADRRIRCGGDLPVVWMQLIQRLMQASAEATSASLSPGDLGVQYEPHPYGR